MENRIYVGDIIKMTASKFVKNVSWIFIGNVAHAALQFLLNILVARRFGSADYGLINYGASLIAFFSTICTLGFNGVITKSFVENEDKSWTYLSSAIILRCIASLISIVLLQGLIQIANPNESRMQVVILFQSFGILFSAFDLFVYWFQYKQQAKYVAIIRLAAFAVSALWRIFAVFIFESIEAYVAGASAETAFYAVFLYCLYWKCSGFKHPIFDWSLLKKLLSTSYPFIFASILTVIYMQTDKIMLQKMIDSSAVGLYSVSQTLAGAVSVIPVALIEGFRPDIMHYKVNNDEMYRKRLMQLYGIVFWVCIAYCLFITTCSRQIIGILYGSEYIDAASSLSVIVWYTSFSYFGAINNLYLIAEAKTKWVQLLTLIGAVMNIVLNAILIPRFGIIGAAAASLATQFVANFVMIYLFRPLRECFYLMIRGIAFRLG